MKNKDILNALGGIDPEFIADAEKFNAEKYNGENTAASVKKTPRIEWKKWTLAAACVCLAVIMVAALLPKLWTDPTPPTPSGSDIFYNENGELDEKLIFANLSQVVWDTSVTSPEEEKPLGQIYEWNGLRLEEELYNKLITAGENDLFAVRVIYDGTKLYDSYAPSINAIEDIQGYIDMLKSEADQLEAFKSEVEIFLVTKPTNEAKNSFYAKSVEKYGDSFVNNYMYNGYYDSTLLESRLTLLRNIIPEGDDITDLRQALLENMVLLDCHEIIQSTGIRTARLIGDQVVAFAGGSILKAFAKNIDRYYDENNISDRNPRSGFVFTLAPAYLVEKLKEIAEIPSNGYYDPSENTSFAFSKLKFYSTDTTFASNLDVIKEVKKCYDYYDDLTFKVTYSGKLPAEKLSAMEYSAINKSKDGTTVTVTVNYSNFDSEALKELSRDTNVKGIFVSYPEGAEMGFAKDKIYFGYPGYDFSDPEILAEGKMLVNDRRTIIEKIELLSKYKNPHKNDNVFLIIGTNKRADEISDYVTKNCSDLYESIILGENGGLRIIVPQKNIIQFTETIRQLSYKSDVTSIRLEMQDFIWVS